MAAAHSHSENTLTFEKAQQKSSIAERPGFRHDALPIPRAATEDRGRDAGHDLAIHLQSGGAQRIAHPPQRFSAGDHQRAGPLDRRKQCGEAIRDALCGFGARCAVGQRDTNRRRTGLQGAADRPDLTRAACRDPMQAVAGGRKLAQWRRCGPTRSAPGTAVAALGHGTVWLPAKFAGQPAGAAP